MHTLTATVAIRDGLPAVNVKDDNVWTHDRRTTKLIAELDEQIVDMAYNDVQADFWHVVAPGVAEDHKFDPAAIGQDGRSGGWLTLSGTSFLEYVDPYADDLPFVDGAFGLGEDYDDELATQTRAERSRFVAFANAIEAAQESMEEEFVRRLTEELDMLNERRDECLVRGEN